MKNDPVPDPRPRTPSVIVDRSLRELGVGGGPETLEVDVKVERVETP